jgi:hypothetical protein
MQKIWEFRCYVNGTECAAARKAARKAVNEIRKWYDEQPRAVQGKFISRLRTLIQLPIEEWKPKPFRWLQRECKGLGEVRFDVGSVQYRPLGFQAGEVTFTFVFCATERNDKFVPRNACAIGLQQKTEIEANSDRSVPHDFSLE